MTMKSFWDNFLLSYVILCLLIGVTALTMFGCATIISGKSQTITINSNPQGARCEVMRGGRIIAVVDKTPGAIYIEKTKEDLNILCKKEGYEDSQGFAESGTDTALFGNLIIGGLVGAGVDWASGAHNKYPEYITVNLVPKTGNK
ncbi:MAG: hypothetical protein NZO16_01710 [Deltaproteobacteria bacterium]|nr:hypothetical protein [Deltaproteobacteria bacterium]